MLGNLSVIHSNTFVPSSIKELELGCRLELITEEGLFDSMAVKIGRRFYIVNWANLSCRGAVVDVIIFYLSLKYVVREKANYCGWTEEVNSNFTKAFLKRYGHCAKVAIGTIKKDPI